MDDAIYGALNDIHRVVRFIKTRVKIHQLRSVTYDPYFNEAALRGEVAALHLCKYCRFIQWSKINKDVICARFRIQGVSAEYQGDFDSFGKLIAQLLQDQYTTQYGHLSYPYVYFLSFKGDELCVAVSLNGYGNQKIVNRANFDRLNKQRVRGDIAGD